MITPVRYRVRPVRRFIAVSIVTAGLAAGVAFSATKPIPLAASVGPDFVIALKTATGKPVTTLKAGTYAITVNDKSAIHMFHLVGPGVNKAITSIDFRGKKTLVVKLKAGKYIYQCDPHKADMKSSFLVTP